MQSYDAEAWSRVVGTLDVGAFFNQYWEKEPLVVSGRDGSSFDDLITMADVDALLSSGLLQPPHVRLMRAGVAVDLLSYLSDVDWSTDHRPTIDVVRLATEFQRGATIVIQEIHRWWHALAVLCRSIEEVVGHPVQANAYLTPPTAQGLPLHHDVHDVFVLQVSGSKHWQIYTPSVVLPLRHQWANAEQGAAIEPTMSFTLNAGDVLYMPRGWRHQAATSSGDSFHLTIGIHAYTWMDALRDALAESDTEVELRHAVPPDGRAERNVMELLASRLHPAEVALRMRRRLVATRRPVIKGQLAEVQALASASVHSRFQRRDTVIADLEIYDDDRLALRFEGKLMTFPARTLDAVRFCFAAEFSFLASELPGLDDDGRLVLVRRLVLEGFLEMVRSD